MSYIVPKKKPERCTNCLFMDRITYDCMLGDDYPDFESQYEHCPLIEIPTPHGRLIDADTLLKKAPELQEYLAVLATVVIEAEGSKDE